MIIICLLSKFVCAKCKPQISQAADPGKNPNVPDLGLCGLISAPTDKKIYLFPLILFYSFNMLKLILNPTRLIISFLKGKNRDVFWIKDAFRKLALASYFSNPNSAVSQKQRRKLVNEKYFHKNSKIKIWILESFWKFCKMSLRINNERI